LNKIIIPLLNEPMPAPPPSATTPSTAPAAASGQ
jgi:hypothetical protein